MAHLPRCERVGQMGHLSEGARFVPHTQDLEEVLRCRQEPLTDRIGQSRLCSVHTGPPLGSLIAVLVAIVPRFENERRLPVIMPLRIDQIVQRCAQPSSSLTGSRNASSTVAARAGS